VRGFRALPPGSLAGPATSASPLEHFFRAVFVLMLPMIVFHCVFHFVLTSLNLPCRVDKVSQLRHEGKLAVRVCGDPDMRPLICVYVMTLEKDFGSVFSGASVKIDQHLFARCF
jgi:hypothetical protein